MDASDVQVWIETEREGAQMVVVPYAQSLTDKQLGFRMSATCHSGSGRSTVSQTGQIALSAGRSTRLSRLSLGATGQMECRIEIALRSDGEHAGVFSFDVNDR